MKTNRNKRRTMNFEAMEKRELFAADLGMDFAIATADPEPQAILLPAVQKVNEAASAAATDYIFADSNSGMTTPRRILSATDSGSTPMGMLDVDEGDGSMAAKTKADILIESNGSAGSGWNREHSWPK